MFRCDPPASAMETSTGGKTLNEMRKRKMMWWRKKVMKELGFFPKSTCFIYKQTLMVLCKLNVQVHLWAFIFRPEQKIGRQQSNKGKDT
jgi:hypothetical protein